MLLMPPMLLMQDKKAKEREQNAEPEEEADADMMALMGFGGFGSAKK